MTNPLLKQGFMLQLSCIEFSRNVHRFDPIALSLWVCIMAKPSFLIFIMIIHCSPLEISAFWLLSTHS